jgi:hypothetical protein
VEDETEAEGEKTEGGAALMLLMAGANKLL